MPREPSQAVGSVNGECIKFAREQQDLKMIVVRKRGGPSPSYQSDVEKRIKVEVSAQMLEDWARALGHIPVSFLKGDIRPISVHPERYPREAEVGDYVWQQRTTPEWTDRTVPARHSWILKLLADRYGSVVLAYRVGLYLKSLEGMIGGTVPIPREMVQVIAQLTKLPEALLYGDAIPDERVWDYWGCIQLADERGISPHQLSELIRRA